MKYIWALIPALFVTPALACDKPFSVFQNGPNAILALQIKQSMGKPLAADEETMLKRYQLDSDKYWELIIKSDPVCTTIKDEHDCVSECKNRPKDVVAAAKYHEGNFYYSLPADQRAELERQEKSLEDKWNHMDYVK